MSEARPVYLPNDIRRVAHGLAIHHSALVYAVVASHANDAGIAWPSVDGMANTTQLDPKTIRLAIQHLVKMGMLEVTPRPGNSSLYKLTPPTRWEYHQMVVPPAGTPISSLDPSHQMGDHPSHQMGAEHQQVNTNKLTTNKEDRIAAVAAQPADAGIPPAANTSDRVDADSSKANQPTPLASVPAFILAATPAQSYLNMFTDVADDEPEDSGILREARAAYRTALKAAHDSRGLFADGREDELANAIGDLMLAVEEAEEDEPRRRLGWTEDGLPSAPMALVLYCWRSEEMVGEFFRRLGCQATPAAVIVFEDQLGTLIRTLGDTDETIAIARVGGAMDAVVDQWQAVCIGLGSVPIREPWCIFQRSVFDAAAKIGQNLRTAMAA